MVNKIKNSVGCVLYCFLENIDGERHIHIISYKNAQIIKTFILIYLIGG